MAAPHGVWGIDIGQCALKAVRVELVDGKVVATAFDYVEHPKILSQPDADPDQLTREALDQFLSRNSLKGDLVAIAVPGQSGLARFVKLPPVEEKKIGDIVRFEAKQQIPFPLEEVVWDYQKIGSGEVTDGFALETEIGLFAMKRDMISRALNHYTDVGVEVDIVQMAPLALCNFVAYDLLNKGGVPEENDEEDDTPRGKKKCITALDVGADSSNLVVTDGEKVIWQRPIPLGGNHLTRALSKELKLTFAKAEHLKRNAAKSPPELKTILSALKPVLTDLVGEVQRSLGYFTNSHREAHVAYLVGLGSAFRLPGLQKYLSEKLQLDVKKPGKFNRLGGDEVPTSPVFAENLLSYAVAYGLAIQGLKVGKLTTNLLPPEIRQDRQIRAKKPWATAAAAALFAGVGIFTAGHAWSYNAVKNSAIDKGIQEADAALQAVTTRDGEVTKQVTAVADTARSVKNIIAGRDEQLNWIRLNEYLNNALPQPNGANLRVDGSQFKPGGKKDKDGKITELEPRQVKYWQLDLAREAADDYYSRVKGGESADAPVNDVLRENLCRVDVERVYSYYVPDLKKFYDAAKTYTRENSKEFDAMLQYDVDNPPKEGEGGWVVAIHGVTYQKDGLIFLRETLIYNLARLCGRKFEPPTPSAPGEMIDPIKDRVTHAFLYNCWTVNDPKPGVFEQIGTDVAKVMVGLASGGGDPAQPPVAAPVPGPVGGGAPAGGRESWVPLAATGGGAAPGGAAGGGGPGFAPPSLPPGAGPLIGGRGGPGGGRGGPGGDRPPVPSGAPVPGGNPNENAAAALAAGKVKPRFEFVAMFLWREPTPSDILAKPASTP